MPYEETELSVRIEKKLKQLINRYSQQKEQITLLEQEVTSLKERLESTKQENAELKQERKSLQMALSMVGEGENKTNAIEHINGIVREIDKCLALLNQ
ncbi:MAG: hypothetical protein E7069_09535 [Bacteroidales bacterium]|jgi:regulator of replication initiation timing|nr:hypothetical protein [Bacteroidales bacterium]